MSELNKVVVLFVRKSAVLFFAIVLILAQIGFLVTSFEKLKKKQKAIASLCTYILIYLCITYLCPYMTISAPRSNVFIDNAKKHQQTAKNNEEERRNDPSTVRCTGKSYSLGNFLS